MEESVFDFWDITNRLSAAPWTATEKCRLNVNSLTRVYSVFLPALIVYAMG
nr:MAG TPA: hypothetical protein [Caudoviricetes sp.]DAP20375.1 MAG TPA: hypothetical protein [Caudoviricetes sp.]